MTWAKRVADLAVWIAPRDRRDWALAVRAELAHVQSSQGLGFAVGGLRAAIGWRVSDPSSWVAVARWGLIAGMMLWAVLLLRLGLRLFAVDVLFAVGIGFVGVMAGMVALSTARWGLSVLIGAGAPLLVLAAGYAVLAERLAPDYRFLRYCRALSGEIAVLLVVAIGVAVLIKAHDRRAASA